MTSTLMRSMVKGISWESFSFWLTMGVTYLYVGDIRMSLALTTTLFALKIIFFFFHERIWIRIGWGKHA